MPYIKRIEINGFKTFGVKTALTFDRGFTVITGPNGSGKTNIIDAVIFCLGELSAKRLRAESFSQLIFNGGERSSVKKNEAKVVIQFDNSDGRIPVETTTVTISREIDRSGESVYRINGRKVPRAHLLEVLSVAGISPYGHNIVLQGTLTRMAEISTVERRKIIEDMLGIAQYDAEKAEAEVKLKEADMAIKTAAGQISEIQKRVEDLERERNNLLRYNLLRREIARLESIRISENIRGLEAEAKKLSDEIAEVEGRNRVVLERRESLKAKRRDLENELRKLGFDEVQAKNNRMVDLEVNLRSLKSRLIEVLSKISDKKSTLEKLRGQRERLAGQIESVKAEIEGAEERVKQLEATLEQLSKEIGEKQAIYESMSGDLSGVRSIFEEKAKRLSGLEEQLSQIQKEKISVERNIARIQSEMGVYTQRLKDLKAKREDLTALHVNLRESLTKLEEIADGQRKQIDGLKAALEKRVKKRANIEGEIKEAEKIAELAKEALARFEAQKSLAEKIKSEETALKSIEKLASMGVISGVHGRLRNLIKVEGDYARAVEAASSGWLDSLIVEDFNVAFTCIEALRRMKLGRVKIIPLRNLSPNNSSSNKKVNIDGVSGWVSSLVKCDDRYKTAVDFVLGDTLLALSEDAAIRASKDGFRAVTLSGDLYEAGGGVESGFYRLQVDLSSLIPSDEALKNLEKAVKALKSHLDNRGNIIADLENEISKTQSDVMSLSESLAKIESEIERARKNMSQAEAQIKRIDANIEDLASHVEKGKEQLASLEARLKELSASEGALREEYERLRGEIDLVKIRDSEKRLTALAQEIVRLRQKYGGVESESSTIKLRVERVLKKSMENLTAQLNEVSEQIAAAEKELEGLLREESEVRKSIGNLEGLRSELSRELSEAREKIGFFTSQIDALEEEIAGLEREYENGVRTLNELKIKAQAVGLQIDRFREQLREMGFEEPVELTGILPLEDVGSSLKAMREELKRIGAVNQLAETQYLEQASRYKELSMRLNELEREREAILKFINEIEQKKIRVFMDAFNKINEKINVYFSKLTGGGSASLKLENPENPFSGGVDMIVQFPGKSPILVSGASSGERSVSAVAFLFALQEFSPASFYLFDEIDAHLDVFHVERLGELLAEESSKMQLQFIVITLKPEMISKADGVYGIYGQNGVSHVISMTFKEAIQYGQRSQ